MEAFEPPFVLAALSTTSHTSICAIWSTATSGTDSARHAIQQAQLPHRDDVRCRLVAPLHVRGLNLWRRDIRSCDGKPLQSMEQRGFPDATRAS
jgi:hypothetical protein